MNIIKRNIPVFIIGGITLLIFLGIIFASQKNPPTNEPSLAIIEESKLRASHSYTLGQEEAPVTLVEFSDYECPACKYYQPIVHQMYEQNKESLQLIYRHFPLPQHPNARRAAEAAQAAGSQGKFWEYTTKLFENNEKLDEQSLIEYAQQIGLDTQKFGEDLKSRKFQQEINLDIADATSLRLPGTPSFFLNGKLIQITSAQNFQDQVLQAIREAKDNQGKIENDTKVDSENKNEITSDNEAKYQTINLNYSNGSFEDKISNGFIGQKFRVINNDPESITINILGENRIVPAQEFYENTLSSEGTLVIKEISQGSTTSISVNR